jgi:hypothetical protein
MQLQTRTTIFILGLLVRIVATSFVKAAMMSVTALFCCTISTRGSKMSDLVAYALWTAEPTYHSYPDAS